MKRLLLLVFLTLVTESVVGKNDFDEAQLRLRSNIEAFLREEGFMPNIDSDGDIEFKKEGDVYYVMIDERDTSPFYISLCKMYKYSEKFSRERIKGFLPELNLNKAVKVVFYDNVYSYQAEMYLINAENFKHVFYKLMNQLKLLEEELGDKVTSVSSDVQSL